LREILSDTYLLWDVDFGMWETVLWEFITYRCKTHKYSSKNAKFYAKKFVKYLSKCKFYKILSNTADSTENTVESSVFQSRNFHLIDHSHNFTSHGIWNFIFQKSGLLGQAKRSKIFSTFSVCEYVYTKFEVWEPLRIGCNMW
jgi:hypothetical protein